MGIITTCKTTTNEGDGKNKTSVEVEGSKTYPIVGLMFGSKLSSTNLQTILDFPTPVSCTDKIKIMLTKHGTWRIWEQSLAICLDIKTFLWDPLPSCHCWYKSVNYLWKREKGLHVYIRRKRRGQVWPERYHEIRPQTMVVYAAAVAV